MSRRNLNTPHPVLFSMLKMRMGKLDHEVESPEAEVPFVLVFFSECEHIGNTYTFDMEVQFDYAKKNTNTRLKVTPTPPGVVDNAIQEYKRNLLNVLNHCSNGLTQKQGSISEREIFNMAVREVNIIEKFKEKLLLLQQEKSFLLGKKVLPHEVAFPSLTRYVAQATIEAMFNELLSERKATRASVATPVVTKDFSALAALAAEEEKLVVEKEALAAKKALAAKEASAAEEASRKIQSAMQRLQNAINELEKLNERLRSFALNSIKQEEKLHGNAEAIAATIQNIMNNLPALAISKNEGLQERHRAAVAKHQDVVDSIGKRNIERKQNAAREALECERIEAKQQPTTFIEKHLSDFDADAEKGGRAAAASNCIKRAYSEISNFNAAYEAGVATKKITGTAIRKIALAFVVIATEYNVALSSLSRLSNILLSLSTVAKSIFAKAEKAKVDDEKMKICMAEFSREISSQETTHLVSATQSGFFALPPEPANPATQSIAVFTIEPCK